MRDLQAVTDLVAAAADLFEATGYRRAGDFARWVRAAGDPDPAVRPSSVPACACLDAAFGDVGTTCFRDALIAARPHLSWRGSGRRDAPRGYRDGHTFVELVGPQGHVSSRDIRFGIFAIASHVVYPSHVHEAEEVYLVVSGTAQWQQDEAPFAPRPPGAIVHNAPLQPHAMRSGAAPLLTLWGWCGDIRFDQYRFV